MKIFSKDLFKVKKRTLLFYAGLTWLIAGFNILRVGVLSHFKVEKHWYFFILFLLVFLVFEKMFFKMTKKHTNRILKLEEYQLFFTFFDLKSYITMFFMISLGIFLRYFNFLNDFFIAFFYMGLGFSLSFCGLIFLKNFFMYGKIKIN